MKKDNKIFICIVFVFTLLISGCFQDNISGNVIVYEEGLNDETIKVGALYPLTGYASLYGEGELMGVRMAVDEINSNGGVNGLEIELIVEDYQSKTSEIPKLYNKLIDIDDVVAVIGPTWTAFVEPGIEVFNSKKVPTIMTSGDAKYSTLKGYGDYFFTVWPSVDNGHEVLLNELSIREIESLAIVYDDGSPYSIEMAEDMREKSLSIGFKVIMLQTDYNANDFKTEILKLKQYNINALYMPLTSPDRTKAIMQEAIRQNFDDKMIVGVEYSFEESLKDEYLAWEGDVIFAYPRSNMNRVEVFEERFFDKYGVSSSVYGSSTKTAYDAVYILKQALESKLDTQVELREALLSANIDGVSQEVVRFDENGIVGVPSYEIKSVN